MIRNRTKKNQEIKTVKNSQGNLIYDQINIANELNNRFTEINEQLEIWFQILIIKSSPQ